MIAIVDLVRCAPDAFKGLVVQQDGGCNLAKELVDVLKMVQLLCERRIFTVNAEHRGRAPENFISKT
jgi:hypothetical protein